MWLNIGFCIALFYVVNTQSNSPNDKQEEVFVDVIKNISRVNNVLQELISNYETLQKIYKSQENLDSSKYSDSEIDDMFQNIKKKPKSLTSKATKKEKFAATEMYWSDHEEETINYNVKNIKPKKVHKKENVVHRDENVVRPKPRTSTTTLKSEESSSDEFSDSDKNIESKLKKKIKTLPKYGKEKNNKLIPKSKEAKTGFDDSYAISALGKILSPFLDTETAKSRSRTISIDREKKAKPGSNIPYLDLSEGVKGVDISKKKHKPRADVSKILRTYIKNMSSEALPTKRTFYDLVKDKSIQVEAHSEIIMENVNHPDTKSEKKNRNNIKYKEKRRDIKKHHHKKDDMDKIAVNETQHTLLRTDNVRVEKANVTHHKKKKYLEKFNNGTKTIQSIDHETHNDNHKTIVDKYKEATSDSDKDSKIRQDDNKTDDIGYKKLPDHEKANKRHKKTDIEPEKTSKDYKIVNSNEEQRGTVAKSKKKKQSHETQVTSSDESLFMEKNDTHVLREAYGEACMKVVVRKCYKACTKTTKIVCSQTKCKSSVKSKVKEHAKTGCLNRFTAKELSASKKDLEKDADLFSHKRRALQENFNNLNDGEFHVCLPTLSVQTTFQEPTLKPSTNETNSPKRKMNPKATEAKLSFNILRDRFERACKKLSYEKCRDACTCSWDNACKNYDCSKRLKKLYKKTCKSSCKSAYDVSSKSKSDSSSSDSDDKSNSS